MAYKFKVGVYCGLNITRIDVHRTTITFNDTHLKPILFACDGDEYFTLDYKSEFLSWGGSVDLLGGSFYRLYDDTITIYSGSPEPTPIVPVEPVPTVQDLNEPSVLEVIESPQDISSNNEIVVDVDVIENAEVVHKRICDNFEKVERTLYDICVDFKTIKDNKYYKSLGYYTFEDYCNECFNINRAMAYRYISVAENLSSDFVYSSIQKNIGVNKLYILSRLSENERNEIINTTDIEHTPVKQLEQKSKEIKQAREVTKNDSELSSQDKEMLEAINDFEDFMENADVEEIAQEHGITLHQDDTSNVVPAPVPQNDITSSIGFREFCEILHYSGSRGRNAIDSLFFCYDGQKIKHNLLDYYSHFTKTLNRLLKSNMDILDYETLSRQLSDLIEISTRLGDTLYDVKKSVECEIDKKKRPYLY